MSGQTKPIKSVKGASGWRLFKERFGVFLSPFLFMLSLFLLDFLFRAVYQDAGVTAPFDLVPVSFTLCWSALLTVAALLLPGVFKKIWMGIVLFVASFLPLAHAVIFKVTGSFLAFSDLAFAEDGMSFLSVTYLAIPWQMYVWSALLAATGVFAIVLAPKKQRYSLPKILSLCAVTAACVSTIALQGSALDLPEMQDSFSWLDTCDPNDPDLIYTDFTNANKALLLCGNPQYVFRSVVKQFNGTGEMVESLQNYYAENVKELVPNDMTGHFAGKNVICILGESIDTWMANEAIMPNLCEMQKHSIDFTDHYTPLFLSAATFNTECALNLGFYLPASGTTARTYAVNLYPQSLPRVFRDNGYTANSYHQLAGRYYNRDVVHLTWGYESYNDREVLGFSGHKYLDTSLMEPVSYQKIVHDEPFLSFIITYSGHGPYTDATRVISDPHIEEAARIAETTGARAFTEDEGTWSQYVHAIAHARETDDMLGKLLENLEADGHSKDTVILFFGDHYCKYLTDTDFVMALKGAWDERSICRTPFFIYSCDQAYTPVSKVTGSADMLPTLFNLMGFSYDPTYLAGSDAFSDYGGFVAFRDYSWYDGETWWTPEFDPALETSLTREMCRKVRAYLNASWDTVRSNYFAVAR